MVSIGGHLRDCVLVHCMCICFCSDGSSADDESAVRSFTSDVREQLLQGLADDADSIRYTYMYIPCVHTSGQFGNHTVTTHLHIYQAEDV